MKTFASKLLTKHKLAFLVVFVLSLSLFCTKIAMAQMAQTVSFNENPKIVLPETDFSLVLNINDVNDLFGVGLDLIYDPQILQFVNAEEGGFLSQDGCQVSFLLNQQQTGDIKIAMNRPLPLPPGPPIPGMSLPPACPNNGVSGSGSLVVFNFHALDKAGTSDLSFDFSDSGNGLKIWPAGAPFFMSVQGEWLPGEVIVSDVVAPSVDIIASTTYENIDPKFTVKAILNDNVGISAYSYENNGLLTDYTVTPATSSLTVSHEVTLDPGDNLIKISAEDAAGNIGSSSIVVNYIQPDIEDPEITIKKPTEEENYNLTEVNPKIILSGVAQDNSEVAKVLWESPTASGTAIGTSTWETPAIELTEGGNKITVYAYDEAGNSSSDSLFVNYKKKEQAVAGSGGGVPYFLLINRTNGKHPTKENPDKPGPSNKPSNKGNDQGEETKVLGIEHEFNGNDDEGAWGKVVGGKEAILASYEWAFGKTPTTSEEWDDALKLAQGHWTKQRNLVKEQEAYEIFKKIYLREPDRNNRYDDAAIMLITYGIRPVPRNLNKEKTALKIYIAIFQKLPSTPYDWNIIRAIAYSGAKR